MNAKISEEHLNGSSAVRTCCHATSQNCTPSNPSMGCVYPPIRPQHLGEVLLNGLIYEPRRTPNILKNGKKNCCFPCFSKKIYFTPPQKSQSLSPGSTCTCTHGTMQCDLRSWTSTANSHRAKTIPQQLNAPGRSACGTKMQGPWPLLTLLHGTDASAEADLLST